MNIGLISTVGATWGGSEELWAAMAAEARRRGYGVCAAIMRPAERAPRVVALREAGVQFFTRRAAVYGRFDRLINRYRFPFRGLLACEPDVLCISQGTVFTWLNTGELETLLPKIAQRRIPYVIVCHGNLDSAVESRALREEARRVLGGASRVVFISQRMVHLAERQIAAALPNAVVLTNPVNMTDRSAVPWPAGGPARMANVARVEIATKGHDLLLEVLASEAWKGRDWRFRVYGGGDSLDYLKDLTDYYGLGGRVELKGHAGDIRAVWADNHLMVMPSRTEGVPLAMVEAMLCGRPGLVTDVGGITEWLSEPEQGFVAEAPTVTSVGAALERAWAAQGQWQAMGERARERALSKIDPDPGASLLKVLEEAAAKRQSD